VVDERDPEWPGTADLAVAPGIPGQDIDLGSEEQPYPEDTTDVIKMLREKGLRVSYLDSESRRALVAHKAADYWAPIIAFTASALANGAGTILAQVLMSRIGLARLETTRLRVKVGRRSDQDGTIEWFEADGPAAEVIEAMQVALKDGSNGPHRRAR
jgi:hypothetical protein